MTKEQLKELHKLNIHSDLDMLNKLLEYCNEEDRDEVRHLIHLNNEVGIGWGEEGEYPGQRQEYFDRKFALLAKYDDLEKWYGDDDSAPWLADEEEPFGNDSFEEEKS